ncbi:hypothetical protein PG995_005517 [Apiospora arundinis]
MIRHRRSLAGENSDDLPKIKITRSGSVVVLPRIPELDMTLEQIEYNNRAREAARQLSQSAQVPINPGPGIAAGEVGGERPVEGSLAEQKRVRFRLPDHQAQDTEQETDSQDTRHTVQVPIGHKREMSHGSPPQAQSKIPKMWPRPPTPWAPAADAVSYQSDTRNDRPQPTKDLPSDERLSDMALAFRQPSPDDRPARHSLPTLESRATSPRARPRPSASADQADQAPVLTAPTLPAAESPPQTQSPSPTAAAAHPPPLPAAAAAAALCREQKGKIEKHRTPTERRTR